MIQGNRLCFGYGDIAVEYEFKKSKQVTFYQMAYSLECGLSSLEVEKIGEPIELCFQDEEDYNEFVKRLNLVDAGESKEFTFHDILFDFSHAEKASVSVCKDAARRAMFPFLIALAC